MRKETRELMEQICIENLEYSKSAPPDLSETAIDKAVKLYTTLKEDEEARREFWGQMADCAGRIAIGVAGLIAYNGWFKMGLKFEETGTINSGFVRNLSSRLLPKK